MNKAGSGFGRAVKTLTGLGVKHVYAVRGLAGEPMDFCIVFPIVAGLQREKLIEIVRADPSTQVKVRDNAIVVAPTNAMQIMDNLRPAPRPEIAEAFAAAGDGAVHVAVVIPTPLRRALVEMMPALPKELDAASMTVLTKGLRWLALKADTTPDVALSVLIRAEGQAAAKDLNALIGKFVSVGKKMMPELDKLFDLAAFKTKDETLIASVTGNDLVRASTPLLKQARDAASRSQGANNLKQIALAMHSYYDVNKGFPTMATYDKKGTALLSWRVHILPYLEQTHVYQQFKLDEPWDSEHNKKLIPLMPEVYKAPYATKAAMNGETVYLLPVGPTTIFPGKKGIKFQDITDGTSNTILIVEAAEKSAVIWTKPDDWKFNPQDPLAGLVDSARKSFTVAIADGSVRSLPTNIDPKTLAALFTRGGGEVVNAP